MSHPLKARALETESQARSGSSVPGDVMALVIAGCADNQPGCPPTRWCRFSFPSHPLLTNPCHKQCSVYTHLKLLVLLERKEPRGPIPAQAVQPWLLLVLLDTGRKTHKKTEKQDCGDSCSLGRFPSTHGVQGTDLAVPHLPARLEHKPEPTRPCPQGRLALPQHQTRQGMNAGFGRTG